MPAEGATAAHLPDVRGMSIEVSNGTRDGY
jgi:hypothetical protein